MNKKNVGQFLHPFLFSVAPIVILYNFNKDLLEISLLVKPFLLTLSTVLFFYLLLEKIIADAKKRSIIISLFLGLFYLLGHIIRFNGYQLLPGITVFDYQVLPVFFLVFFLALVILVISSKRKFTLFTEYLNLFSFLLIIFPLGSIIFYSLSSSDIFSGRQAEFSKNTSTTFNNKHLPDIYYIILDGYGRSDILKKYYDYDNSWFIDILKDQGFYVAEKSRANYPQTYLSVSSSLNFSYLDSIINNFDEDSEDRSALAELIKENNVSKVLKSNGYKIVRFPSSWIGAERVTADMSFPYSGEMNEFTKMIINITPVKIITGDYSADGFRKKILYTFDNASRLKNYDSPTFAYIHILSPHPPFVFDSEGDFLHSQVRFNGKDGSQYFEVFPDREDYKIKYRDQLSFVSKKIVGLTEQLLAGEDDPIIIIQSDHGPGLMLDWDDADNTNMEERLSILNAYYIPGNDYENFYQTISPVNSFRMILNTLFDKKLEILEDKSYFAVWNKPYDFMPVLQGP